MSIPILLAAFLLADPDPDSTASILGASPLGQAGVRAFEASLLANVDPLAAPAKLPFAADDKGSSLLSYTYAELGYERTNIDLIPDDSNAYYLKGSFGFLKFFNVVAGYERADTDFDNIKVDTYWIGGGGHFSIDIASPAFAGKNMLASHRMVLQAIEHLMRGDLAPVHAVDSIKTRTS